MNHVSFGLSLVDVKSRTSFVLGAQQVVYNADDKSRITAHKAKKIAQTQAQKTVLYIQKVVKQVLKIKKKKKTRQPHLEHLKLCLMR